MSSPKELHISFKHLGVDYRIDLIKKKKSSHSVKINGTSYAVLGEKDKLNTACKLLGSVSLDSVTTEEDLQKRLSSLKDIAFLPTKKTDDIGKKALLEPDTAPTKAIEKAKLVEENRIVPQKTHTWLNNENIKLPRKRELLAKAYWDMRGQKGDHTSLKDFLGPKQAEKLDTAMKTSDFKAFLSLFDDFSEDEIRSTYFVENLNYPLGFVKTEPYTITLEDRQNLKQYLDDIDFSGVVHLSDATSTYCICPTKLEKLEGVPFSMHSIGKVFTGSLALMTFTSEDYNAKISLDSTVISTLPAQVRKHLSKPTLIQTMNHRGGFGDYLGNYQKAIEEALKNKEELPLITKPEDFLKYAESSIFPIDHPHYSNLGILLVGLAIQHDHNKDLMAKIKKAEKHLKYLISKKDHTKSGKAVLDVQIQAQEKRLEKLRSAYEPFDKILEKQILQKAGMTISSKRPDTSLFSKDDPCHGETVGGPAGGYWITSKNLHQLGTWLRDKCISEPAFLSSLEKYGSEFYVQDDREIHHNGNSPAGSAFLSSFLDSRVTISILSDQSNFRADKVYYAIRENIIEQS